MEATPRQRHLSSDSDLEPLSMIDLEAAISMSLTDAVFTSVLPHYPVGAHIQCRCQVTQELDLAIGCWIGLFKVGWASPESDCVCRAECRREGDRTLVAVFTQTQLPRDTKDFYQFCFVAADGLVKGASSPFLFRGAPSDDFVAELDEELQGVVVSARTAQLENTLANMRLEHEAQRSAADEEAEQLRRRLNAVKEELQDARQLAAAAVEERVRLEARAADAESRAADAESLAGRLRAELDTHTGDLQRLDEARQSTAARLIGAEDERQRLLRRLEEAARDLDAANNQAEAARKSLELHADERKQMIEQMTLDRAMTEELAERLRVAEVQLSDAGEREKRMLETLTQAQADSQADNAALQAERAARQAAEAAACQLRVELAARQQQEAVSGELRAQHARYACLLTAYEGVKRQFHDAEEREQLVRLKYDEVIVCNKQMLDREERLHARLAELQARLKEGGCEYKKLMKKCRDLQRQQQAQQPMPQQQLDAADPEEFHDAQSDEQSLLDEGFVIHRPPVMTPTALAVNQAAVSEQPPRSLPEAAAAVAAATAGSPLSERSCPVCNAKGFGDQRSFEEHVHGHFSE